MTDHSSEAPPTYLRLSPASWAEVGEAYVNGATAKELAALWKTSPSSIYRHAGLEGWTKKARGDAVARAHVAARRAEADERRTAGTALPARRRADGVAACSARDGGPPLSSDPADLKAAALERLAAAIHAGRDHEALRLSALVQRLEKLIETGDERDAAARQAQAAVEAEAEVEAQRVPTYPGEPGARPWPKPPPEGYPDDGGSFIDWRPTREAMEREHYLMFRCIAFTALAMLHKPQAVHPMLMRQVYAFRRDFLGETDRAQIMKNASILTERILLEVEDFAFERVDVVNPDTGVRERLRTWPPVEPPFPDPDWKPKPPRKRPPPMPLFRGKRVSA
jgi:hypothetical protein